MSREGYERMKAGTYRGRHDGERESKERQREGGRLHDGQDERAKNEGSKKRGK